MVRREYLEMKSSSHFTKGERGSEKRLGLTGERSSDQIPQAFQTHIQKYFPTLTHSTTIPISCGDHLHKWPRASTWDSSSPPSPNPLRYKILLQIFQIHLLLLISSATAGPHNDWPGLVTTVVLTSLQGSFYFAFSEHLPLHLPPRELWKTEMVCRALLTIHLRSTIKWVKSKVPSEPSNLFLIWSLPSPLTSSFTTHNFSQAPVLQFFHCHLWL